MLRRSRTLFLLGLALGVMAASKGQYTVPGVVRSPRPVCERNRLVKVVTPTTKLSDRTNRAGKWSVRLPIEHAVGGTCKATPVRKVVRKDRRTIVCARAVDRYALNEG